MLSDCMRLVMTTIQIMRMRKSSAATAMPMYTTTCGMAGMAALKSSATSAERNPQIRRALSMASDASDANMSAIT